MAPPNLQRSELKYLISDQEYQILLQRLKQVLPQDFYQKNERGYFVRSLYFDSHHDQSWRETLEGFYLRKKYRLRIYDFDSSEVKFEIKNKINNQILKETILISKSSAIRAIKGDYADFLNYDNEILNRTYAKFILGNYQPKTIIEYRRTAFFIDLFNVRITVDSDIRKTNSNFDIFSKNLTTTPIISNDKHLLEIKFHQTLPDYIKEILQLKRFEKSGFSKYFTARNYE